MTVQRTSLHEASRLVPTNCAACGTALPPYTRGRPRRYCSDACKDIGAASPEGRQAEIMRRRHWTERYLVEDHGYLTPCHIWQGATNPKGYGDVRIGGHSYRTHRLAYALAHGPLEPRQVVDHLCNQPRCMNPDHLRSRTSGDNIARGNAIRKAEGTGRYAKIEARLPEVKRLREAGWRTWEIAERLGVSEMTIKLDDKRRLAASAEWYDDHRELNLLLEWLAERGEIRTLQHAIDVTEKPWHWTLERDAMHAERAREES